MAPRITPAKLLLGSFKELGLATAQVRRLLPSWWEDEAAEDEAGLLELQMLLSRRLNVSLESLLSVQPAPQFRESVQRFKTVHPQGSSQLAVAASIGQGLAGLLASTVDAGWPTHLPDAAEVRAQVLRASPTVTLEALCEWCWSLGVPVVHVTNWPAGLRRPDAMCMRIGVRPVIMVVRREKVPAKLAFLVAHELGHVLLGHLREDSDAVLVDEALPVDAQRSFIDDDERMADDFADTVLGGSALDTAAKDMLNNYTSPLKLAVAALERCKDQPLQADQLILAWARKAKDWPTANAALNFLMTNGPAPMTINRVALRALSIERLSFDGRDHLEQLTGMELTTR